jgi:predicted amidophosphoribosyltransferase
MTDEVKPNEKLCPDCGKPMLKRFARCWRCREKALEQTTRRHVLRDQYAGLAMQGLLAAGMRSDSAINVGQIAVSYADELIRALEEKP